MSRPRECVEIYSVACVKETDKAICVVYGRLSREVWIPKSVLGEDSEVTEEDDEGTLQVHKWFAEKEDL